MFFNDWLISLNIDGLRKMGFGGGGGGSYLFTMGLFFLFFSFSFPLFSSYMLSLYTCMIFPVSL